MGLMDSLKVWIRSEGKTAGEISKKLQADWSSDLDRAETELNASPSERIDGIQDKIADNSAAFEKLKAKLARTGPISAIPEAELNVASKAKNAEIVDAEIVEPQPFDPGDDSPERRA